jgi:glycosyltransferase involved in cell wall biosynthesis
LKVPIACTLQGEDLFLNQLPEPWRTESIDLIKRCVPDVDVFLSVSDAYVDYMSGLLGIPRGRIKVVPLGINMDGHHPKTTRTEPPYTVGFFGRIAPEKGLHVLAEAYRRLRSRPGVPPTRLLAGGYMLNEHRPYLDGIMRDIREWGLAGEFRYAGAMDRHAKIALLHQMDVMSMPATYDEPKGFTLIEAMANGVPVVLPQHGAFPELVEETGGGILVRPNDPEALALGLATLVEDGERRRQLGVQGERAVHERFAAAAMARETVAAYRQGGGLAETA